MAKAIWNGVVIAESNQTIVVENNHYFPPSAVQRQFLRDSGHRTVCGWKGEASYYDVVVNGQTNANAAWYYPQTKDAAKNIEGCQATIKIPCQRHSQFPFPGPSSLGFNDN